MTPPSNFVDSMLDALQKDGGLSSDEARELLTYVHRLDRVHLAALSGYALGLAVNPRHTQLQPEVCPSAYHARQA